MSDHDDWDWDQIGDDTLLVSLFTSGPWAWIVLAASIVFFVMAIQQSRECNEKHCAHGAATVVKGECVCLEKAR